MQIQYFTEPTQDFISLVVLLDQEFTVKNGVIQKAYDSFNTLNGIRDFFIAYDGDIPVGIAALKPHDQNSYEVKRVFVREDCRGRGLSKLLMKKLEEKAVEYGAGFLILETSATFTEARNLYQSIGYQVIENFGPYVGMSFSVCMRKAIGR